MPEIYPATELAATNVSGNVADLQNNDTSSFYNVVNADNDWSARWDMQDPGADLSGTQNVDIYTDGINGTGASVTVELWENGSLVTTIVSGAAIPSGTSVISGTFDASSVINSADVEIRVAVSRGGGMPGARANANLGYITWDATLQADFVEVTTDPASGIGTDTATLNGTVNWTGSTVDVWFDYGEVGAGFPNSTTAQTITTTGEVSFDEAISSLSPDTEYEYRAQADRDNGTETDTGLTVTFTTNVLLSGVCTVSGSAVSGAEIYIVNPTTETVLATATSDGSGNWSATVGSGQTVHIIAEYDDGSGNQYNTKTYPYVGV